MLTILLFSLKAIHAIIWVIPLNKKKLFVLSMHYQTSRRTLSMFRARYFGTICMQKKGGGGRNKTMAPWPQASISEVSLHSKKLLLKGNYNEPQTKAQPKLCKQKYGTFCLMPSASYVALIWSEPFLLEGLLMSIYMYFDMFACSVTCSSTVAGTKG